MATGSTPQNSTLDRTLAQLTGPGGGVGVVHEPVVHVCDPVHQ